MRRRVLLILGFFAMALSGCESDPLDIDDPDLFNGAWIGTSTATLYNPDTGAVICTDSSSPTTLELRSTDTTNVSATLQFGACDGRAVPGGVWEASGCRVGSGAVGTSVACGSFDAATSVMNSFTIEWAADGSPTELIWRHSEPPSGGGSPNLSAEAEGILSR